MTKEIICVFQDCVLCGNRGKVIKDFADAKGLLIRKVSFASEEGRTLCHDAVLEHGIKTMPFFTDGEKYSSELIDFVEKKATASKKEPTKKKTTKKGKK